MLGASERPHAASLPGKINRLHHLAVVTLVRMQYWHVLLAFDSLHTVLMAHDKEGGGSEYHKKALSLKIDGRLVSCRASGPRHFWTSRAAAEAYCSVPTWLREAWTSLP